MRRQFRRMVVALALALPAVLGRPVPDAGAHPHVWIDVTVELRFDGEGRITGLRQTWLFDEFYSAFSVMDLGGPRARPSPEQLGELMRANMRNLADYGYFTRATAGEEVVPVARVSEVAGRMNGARLEGGFLAELARPVDPARTPFSYAVFDPTYYVMLTHAGGAAGVTLTDAPPSCRAALEPAAPSESQIAFAAALDRSQSGGDTLGQAFAELVTVTCGGS